MCKKSFFLSLFLSFNSWASPICSDQKSEIAERHLENIYVDWKSLYSHWTVFSNCDDGLIAEGYSDAVSQLLLRRMQGLQNLTKDPVFETFVLNHIDESVPREQLQKIQKHVQKCNDSICKKISTKIDFLICQDRECQTL